MTGDKQEHEIATIRDLPHPRLISGQLDVSNLQIQMEENQ